VIVTIYAKLEENPETLFMSYWRQICRSKELCDKTCHQKRWHTCDWSTIILNTTVVKLFLWKMIGSFHLNQGRQMILL